MSTECLMPLDNRVAHSSCRLHWGQSVTYGSSETVATAPMFNSFESGCSGENHGSSLVCLCGVPDDVRHCLASFLSSGDENTLSLSNDNVGHYVQIANDLHHVPLQNICQKFFNELDRNGNVQVHAQDHNDCVRNNNIPHCPNTPVFQIMFLRQGVTSQTNQVLVMDIRKNEVQKIDVKKLARFGDGFASCAAYKKGCPYVLVSGGSGKNSSAMMKYDVVENKWVVCDNMRNPRSKHSMAFMDGNVYIIGGKGCSSVEKYSIESNFYTEVCRLPVPVHSSAVTIYREKIYVFGGKTLKGNVRCVQCLDTRTNKVTRLQDLPSECSGGHAIVVNETIYFATNNGHMIKFYPETGQSELCSHQPFRRKHFTMFSKNDELIIYGGINTEGPTDNEALGKEHGLYCYSAENDTWSRSYSFKSHSDLPVHTSCTVRYPKECPVKPFIKLFGYC